MPLASEPERRATQNRICDPLNNLINLNMCMITSFQLLKTLSEGGWATTATQKTKITPATVHACVNIMTNLVQQFNSWLATHEPDHAPIQVGEPTGSGYWYMHDADDKEYGDVDLQMIAQNPDNLSHSSYSAHWNKLWVNWCDQVKPDQIDLIHSTPGHPILKVDSGLVQIDFMWHEPELAVWGLARSVPPRGLKGMLNGNLFGVLGQMLNMSLQHAGVQIKTQQGQPVPFSKQKDVMIHTISADPGHMLVHILEWVSGKPESELQIHAMLTQYPGVKWPHPDVTHLIKGIQGLAVSFGMNDLYGKGVLSAYENASDWLNKFWQIYEQKALTEIDNPKRAKAETPQAQARAARDKLAIQQGLDHVHKIWNQFKV